MAWRLAARVLLLEAERVLPLSAPGRTRGITPHFCSAQRLLSSQQTHLPRLPVPALNQTADRLLDTLRPLTTDQEYSQVKQLVHKLFNDDQVSGKYQQFLQNRANNAKNWLTDWWLNIAYLENRLPCCIHVNPGVIGPVQPFRDQESQLRYAARLLSAILDYKQKVDNGSVTIDKMGGSPLCMSQYYKILGSCRVPGVQKDGVYNPSVESDMPAHHIIVMRNNHMFALDVYGTDGRVLNIEQLFEQLKRVASQSGEPAPGLGVMTTEDRDQWGKIYTELLQDNQNRSNFDEVNRSAIVLCLDKAVPVQGNTEKADLNCHQMNNGAGSMHNTCNRWFDKILQVIVSEDGIVGANYEHSTAEGPPVVSILDHSIKLAEKNTLDQEPAAGTTEPRHLKFNLTNTSLEAIEDAKKKIDTLIADLELKTYSFTEFGKNTLKSLKISPDAFIQVTLQHAYYRLHNRSVATYESGSLRKFLEGRTDTIRSCTSAARDYCIGMEEGTTSLQEKGKLLREAIQAHRKYTAVTIDGQGIDRHMLGLKLAACEFGDPIPDLYSSPIYQKGSHWTLSTSQVASDTGNMCYGPAVPEGYGFCYNPKNDCINFVFSAWNSNNETSCSRLADSMHQSLMDGYKALTASNESKL